ncbi:MAG: phosphate ABC transporter permease subunit PstC [Pseudomonadota bacterium]
MTLTSLFLLLLAMTVVAFIYARGRSLQTVGGRQNAGQLHSLPGYYGSLAAIWCVVPALILLVLWSVLEGPIIDRQVGAQIDIQQTDAASVDLLLNQAKNLLESGNLESESDPTRRALAEHYDVLQQRSTNLRAALAIAIAVISAAYACSRITRTLRARVRVERFMLGVLAASASVAILTTLGIVLSVLFEALQFFREIPPTDFLFGTVWSPQTAIREDQVGASGSFGAIPLFVGTLLISAIALLVAVPIGLMSAIYLSEYAPSRLRSVAKPVMEVLAGIPTVVYGFFAVLTVAPAIRRFGEAIGLNVASESALAAGLVMGIMIIPFVSSLSDDVIKAVPQAMRDGSFGLGATKSETIRQVVIPAALPGIVGSILLDASRAIGETMIVVMAAGLSAKLTINPLDAVTTVTVQIVTLLTGDQEFDSAKTLAAFALGLMLFFTTLLLNVFALHVVRKYREQYE